MILALHWPAHRHWVAALLLVSLVACGGNGEPTVPPPSTGTLKATVDGEPWDASGTRPVAAVDAASSVTIAGTRATIPGTLTLALASISATGTYPLGVGSTLSGGKLAISINGTLWVTPSSGDAGTVTVTTFTATRIAGTFSGRAMLDGGSGPTATRTVTNGVFDLPLSGASTRAVPSNRGGSVAGTLDGTAFAPGDAYAFRAANGAARDTSLLIVFNRDTQTVTVTIDLYAGARTYATGASAPHVVELRNGAAPQGRSVADAANGAAVITISSATASRVRGTITGTLQPTSGVARTGVPVNVRFDVGIR